MRTSSSEATPADGAFRAQSGALALILGACGHTRPARPLTAPDWAQQIAM
jgi:hypothetical protein